MAKYQYRICGPLAWQSSSGNAIFVIVNPNGSGHKITIREVEMNCLAGTEAGLSGANSRDRGRMHLSRATITGGVEIHTPVKFDTDASAWPSTVKVLTQAGTSSREVLRTISPNKLLSPSATTFNTAVRHTPLPTLFGGIFRKKKDSTTEGIVIRAGEGVALHDGAMLTSEYRGVHPYRVSATLVRVGSPNRAYKVEFITSSTCEYGALFAVNNESGSGETIILRDIGIDELGDTSTPYFQLVPVGAVLEEQSTRSPAVIKMDSDYPDPSAWMTVYQDAAILPFGMPENALADSSIGSPKGFNYLKTKDFLGPVYRTVFPEGFAMIRAGATVPDTLAAGMGHGRQDPFMRKAGVTIRPGEGIALVSAAESATSTAGAGISGWQPWHFNIAVDIEQEFQPTLTITGLKNPSEVRIFDAGTTTELAGQENVTTGSFEWVFDPAVYPDVDISILALSYQNIRFTNFALSMADVTIPVQQQVDRQYANP